MMKGETTRRHEVEPDGFEQARILSAVEPIIQVISMISFHFQTIATIGFAFVTAVLYVGVTIILKHWSALPAWLAVVAAALCFLLACVAEIEVLRRATVAEVVALIIAFEVSIAVVVSRFVMGDVMSAGNVAGFGLVILGVAVLTWSGFELEADREETRSAAAD